MKYDRSSDGVHQALKEMCEEAERKGPMATQWFLVPALEQRTGFNVHYLREALKRLHGQKRVQKRQRVVPLAMGGRHLKEWRVT